MFDQHREKNQKPLPQEGIAELSEEQLEDVSGGGINYDAQIQILRGELAAYQYLGTLDAPKVVYKRPTTDPRYRG